MVLPTFTLVHSDEFCFSVSCGGACCRSCGFRTGRIGGCGRCAHHVYIGLFALDSFFVCLDDRTDHLLGVFAAFDHTGESDFRIICRGIADEERVLDSAADLGRTGLDCHIKSQV